MKASSLALALLAAVLPELAAAQGVLLGSEREPGGTVLGRVCLDLDRDGRCGDDEPGVAGARVVAEDGAIALADGRGRYHLLERQTRIVLRDRAAYGGHVVAAEGLGVRRAFELAPAGAASIDLPVPPPAAEPPALAPAQPDDPGLTDAPARRDDGLLGWTLAGRVPPGAHAHDRGRGRGGGGGRRLSRGGGARAGRERLPGHGARSARRRGRPLLDASTAFPARGAAISSSPRRPFASPR